MPKLLTLVIGLAVATQSWAAQPAVQESRDGFREAILSVEDLNGAIDLYRQVGGWELRYEGDAARSTLDFFGLGKEISAREALLINPGDSEGFLRLFEFSGPGLESPQRARPSGRTWDPGGIFNVNVRVADIHEKARQLRARGFHGYSEPIRFEFSQFIVWEVLMRGPHDEVFALIERVQPPLEGWTNLGDGFSHIFNSTQIVSDFEAAKTFYTEALGFEVYFENRGPSASPGPNVLGLPHDLTAEIPRRVAILSPSGRNFGSVEILAFEGLEGAHHRETARAANVGWLALRFPTEDARALARRLAERGVETETGVVQIDVGYGEGTRRVAAFAVLTPDGARLEFLEM